MYKVNVGGENFVIHLDGRERRINLLKPYYLSVENEGIAKYTALGKLKEELKDKVLNDLSDPPEMYVQSIEIVKSAPKDASREIYWNEIKSPDEDSNV